MTLSIIWVSHEDFHRFHGRPPINPRSFIRCVRASVCACVCVLQYVVGWWAYGHDVESWCLVWSLVSCGFACMSHHVALILSASGYICQVLSRSMCLCFRLWCGTASILLFSNQAHGPRLPHSRNCDITAHPLIPLPIITAPVLGTCEPQTFCGDHQETLPPRVTF